MDFLYQFWKLKRKANLNQPLVTLKRDEVDNLAQQEQDVLYRRLKLFTHLRQDLERVSKTVEKFASCAQHQTAVLLCAHISLFVSVLDLYSIADIVEEVIYNFQNVN